MLTTTPIIIAILVIAFLTVAAFQPSAYRVQRSLAISASPAELFSEINDLKKAQIWSPWMKMDPAARISFEGPPAGVGASFNWSGNRKIGEGRQTITASRANELVRSKLEFKKPFEGDATAEFTLKREGPRTVVTWAMFGENNFLSKAVCIFMNQDKMIGGPFEEGLSSLQALVEPTATNLPPL